MSFITYVLLVGYCKGASNKFTPEVLIQAVWRCLLLQLGECMVFKLCVGSMRSNIPFLDIFAYTGYKYLGLCIGLVALVLGKTLYFLVTLVLGLSLGYFVMKSIAAVVPVNTPGEVQGPLPRPVMILALAALQTTVFCILSFF
jgi:hypothetical protein